MSYKIVYNKRFIRLGDKIIPLVLYGTNDPSEIISKPNCGGRKKYRRSWGVLYTGTENETILQTPEEILSKANEICNKYKGKHFMFKSRWICDDELTAFFKTGIRNADTIEEMNEKYIFKGINAYLDVQCENKITRENFTKICSSDDLRSFLSDAEKRINGRQKNEKIYINLEYNQEKFLYKNFVHKEYSKEYFIIKNISSESGEYFLRFTSKEIKFTDKIEKSKHFVRKSEAKRCVDRIKERNPDIQLTVMHIDTN